MGSRDLPITEKLFSLGDLPVNHTTFYHVTTLLLDTNLEVYAPNAPGNFPVVYFLTGITGTLNSFSIIFFHFAYANLTFLYRCNPSNELFRFSYAHRQPWVRRRWYLESRQSSKLFQRKLDGSYYKFY